VPDIATANGESPHASASSNKHHHLIVAQKHMVQSQFSNLSSFNLIAIPLYHRLLLFQRSIQHKLILKKTS
jgi:hypothetical protein